MADFELSFDDLGITPEEKSLEPKEPVDRIDALSQKKVISRTVKDLRSGSKNERMSAAWELSHIKEKSVVKALLESLEEEDDFDVLDEIISALGHLADEGAVKSLIKVLSNEENDHLRRKTAWALSRMEKSEKALRALEASLLSDEDENVRAEAAWAIGSLKNPGAMGTLVDVLLADQSKKVRKMVVWALGEVGEKEIVEYLEKCLESDQEEEVRREAAWILGRKRIISALPVLREALRREQNTEVQRMIIWAMGRLPEGEIAKDLEKVLIDDCFELPVKIEAVWVLGKNRQKQAAGMLVRLLHVSEPKLKEIILWALGKMGEKRVIPKLQKYYTWEKDKLLKDEATWVMNEIKSSS